MSWFKRLKEGIQTTTKNKKEAPDGLWHKCTQCATMTTVKELKDNLYLCPKCNYHTRISSSDYFDIIFDGKHTRLFDDVVSVDVLNFTDLKSYKDRLDDAYKKTNLKDAMSVAHGKLGKNVLVVACMDFGFIGGSMGSVVGEKISRSIDFCLQNKTPLLIISKSGGARMMESAFSLMQMAKTAAKLTLLAKNGIPYFSLMTDPTTGGVTASFAMLGDINIAEPQALIGFAGPRVIKETIKKDLPEGFQTSEYLLEHGFLDFIVDRKDLKSRLSDLLVLFDGGRFADISED
ncbi:MAG: acetyl-CoA carboxylase carboxyltransferase subunit beta [Saprospiraceae bacterium]|nr:acetyl-CoA carboxylase carboxyltransferase subunit beta [Saprospiraceae bacterium]MBK6565815.1 acetyl-CoA carboxylase carboxyltransferase subunit beta [Saprospiraceae bacterium]MBK7524891.1 acetyl-CoA carboxylase carboxyltransferase subunit beta [Saprospiraceae bacterium]MBK8370174.1 acetyl-CoA carboxylase carboxyltransferase subunit beta [Saprospiraceae bacterium]MBK8546812.1 acetyl-CoA carboxylase carboxyltransferase subunit beta [Saprospiraceae bacterium]